MKKIIFVFVVLFGQMFFGQEKEELLEINFPEEYEWNVVTNVENDDIRIIELVPAQENKEDWNLLFTYAYFKNPKKYNVELLKNIVIESYKKNAPKGRVTILGESKKGERAWALYKIENPEFLEKKHQGALLYYTLHGDKNIHTLAVEIKEKSLSEEFVKKWSKVFKEGRLVNE